MKAKEGSLETPLKIQAGDSGGLNKGAEINRFKRHLGKRTSRTW